MRAKKQTRLGALCAAWRNHLHRRFHAHGVEIRAGFAHVIVAQNAIGQEPCAAEIMLHHRYIASFGLRLEFGFVFLDVGELGLLVFLLSGIDDRACECAVESGFTSGLVAVAHELHIKLR